MLCDLQPWIISSPDQFFTFHWSNLIFSDSCTMSERPVGLYICKHIWDAPLHLPAVAHEDIVSPGGFFLPFSLSRSLSLVLQSSGVTLPKISSGRPNTRVSSSTTTSTWPKEKYSSSVWRERPPTSATTSSTATSTRGNWATKWPSTG